MQYLKSFSFRVFRNRGFSFNLSNKAIKRRSFLLSTMIFLSHSMTMKRESCVEEKNDEDNRLRKLEGLKKMKAYEICNSDDIKEGEIKEFFIGEDNKFEIIIIRSGGKLFALNSKCVYDNKTNLKDGIVFENKLYCPIHGCAYNIVSGVPEYAPSMNYLPIYFVTEKEGKVTVFAPEYHIKKILPPFTTRDYNDLRKVVIIGASAAAMGCIQTLKENGFTGEITMISKETKLPYDKTMLCKQIKDLKFDDILLRDHKWFQINGVKYMLGRNVVSIENTHGNPSITLEDGLKLEYDAILIATGTHYEKRNFIGLNKEKNFMMLNNFNDHQKMKKQLETIKKLSIVGINLNSLELASTIRKEYPHIEILVIDENEKNLVQQRYGEELFQALLNLHLDHGVSFLLKSKIESLSNKKGNITGINLKDGRRIETDAIISFPNNVIANTDIVSEAETLENVAFDENARIITDMYQRTEHKRVFAAGDCCSTYYHVNFDRIPCDNWNLAFNEGVIAAYNILALRIPFHMVNFNYVQMYDKIIQNIGWTPFFDEFKTFGDMKQFKFVTIYSLNNEIIAACGTPDDNKSLLIINEAFRLNLMPKFEDIKNGKVTIETLEEKIRKSKKSGCYKELITKIQDDYIPGDVIWIKRDVSQDFGNVWENGNMPTKDVPIYKNE